MGWDLGGDYDAWKTTEPEPTLDEDDSRDDEPANFDERRMEEKDDE